MLATFSAKNGDLWHAPALFVSIAFFPHFLALLATSWAPFGVHFGRFSPSSWLNFGDHLGLSRAAFPSQAPRQTPNFLMDPFAVARSLVVITRGGGNAACRAKDKKPATADKSEGGLFFLVFKVERGRGHYIIP